MRAWLRRHKKLVGLIAAIIFVIAVINIVRLSLADDTDSYLTTEPVTRGDIVKTVLATGTIKPSLQVNVGAQVTGQVTRIYVRQGDQVKKGQLLAEIDPTLQQNDLLTAEAQLASAKAQRHSTEVQINMYRLALQRQQQMHRDGSGVKSDLEQAQAQYEAQVQQLKVNESQIAQAEVSVRNARANLGYTRILAPIDGEVLGIVTNEGQTVVSSQMAPTILVLANLDTMLVQTRISETDILRVKQGQPLWFYVVANPTQRYESVLDSIQSAPTDALQENPGGGGNSFQNAIYYNGEFSIENHNRQLKTSMTAQIFIETEKAENVLRVPTAALGARKENTYQVTVLKDGQQETRWVETGINDRQYSEVISGLSEGEQVVIPTTGANG